MKPKRDELRQQLAKYTIWMVLPPKSIMDMSDLQKLVLVQRTPDKAIKKWPIWLYVPISYIERCLNFVSNFNRWCKVQREGINQSMVKKYDKNTWLEKDIELYEARCLADFYIVIDWKRIERSCYWSWQWFQNPKANRFNVFESARSIATKSFADTLWIASDKLSKEFDAIREKVENDIDIDDATNGFTSSDDK